MKKWWKRVIGGTCAFAFASALAVTHAVRGNAEEQAYSKIPFTNVTGKYDTDILRRTHFNDSVIFADSVGTFTEAKTGTGVYATPYASYYDGAYEIPMGRYLYQGDDTPSPNVKYNAVSAYSENGYENGMATTGINTVVAGLGQEVESARYALCDALTGEAVAEGNAGVKNIGEKAGFVLSQTDLRLSVTELGLVTNRDYVLSLAYAQEDVYECPFTVDYIAPTLQGLRLDYYDYKENGLDKRRAYLEMDIHDNHYAQAVMLCYADGEQLRLATPDPTPVFQTDKNAQSTVRMDVTELIGREENMYLCIDDYALNGSLYRFSWKDLTDYMQPKWGFSLVESEEELTLAKNQAHTVALVPSGDFHSAHFIWESANESVASVQDGVIVGVGAGTTDVRVKVSHSDQYTQTIRVTVTEEEVALPTPKYALETETVALAEDEQFALRVSCAPWYYPSAGVSYAWTTSDERVATVNKDGVIKAVSCGEATIRLQVQKNGKVIDTVTVRVTVTDGFVINSGMLVSYRGRGYNEGSVAEGTAKLVLPEGLTRIGKDAFAGNKEIGTVVLPNTLTRIETGAFARSNLTELVGVELVKRIGDRAFENCKKLQAVTVGQNAVIGESAFAGCTDLETVVVRSSKLHSGSFANLPALKTVTFEASDAVTIGVRAFADSGKNNGLTLSFGETVVKEIGAGAFAGAKFTTTAFTLPTGLKALGTGAFKDSNIQTLVIPDGLDIQTLLLSGEAFAGLAFGVSADNTLYTVEEGGLYARNGENKTLLSAPVTTGLLDLSGTNVTRIGKYAFAGSGVTAVKLSENTETDGIDEGAFAYSNIETIDFNGVALTVIPDYAFAGSKLAKIVLPDSVQTIGAYAFADCPITTFTLPLQLEENGLGEGAFAYSHLQNFSFRTVRVTMFPDYLFIGTKYEKFWLPTEVTTIGAYAFAECEELRYFTGASGVLDIQDYAFYNCNNLNYVLCENVQTVGNGAFEGCDVLIGFGDYSTAKGLETVKTVGDRAFYRTNLNGELSFLEAVSIGNEAFKAKVTGAFYTKVTLPKVQTLGDEAFAGGGYKEISLPLCIESIGAGAFGATSVSSVLAKISFSNGAADNGKFFVKDNVLYRYVNAEKTRYELVCYPAMRAKADAYSVLEGTVRIGARSFYGVKSDVLASVTFPQTLQSIGERAFYESSIGHFKFESLHAPLLEATHSEQVDEQVSRVVAGNGKGYYKGLYYMNFNVRFVNLLQDYTDSVAGIGRTIYYPENGVGYDHFVYATYFQNRMKWGEQMSEETRMFLEGAYALPLVSELSDWKNMEVNAENTATLQALIARVATVRRFYDNALKDEGQSAFISVEAQQRLFTVEKTLREIRQRFGIPVSVVRVEYIKGSAQETYMAGEKFELTDARVNVFYDDGSVEEKMGGLRLKSNETLTVYDAHVELVYTANGKEYTVYAVVDVQDPKGLVVVEEVDRTFGIVLTAIGGVIVLAGAFVVLQPYFKKRKERIAS